MFAMETSSGQSHVGIWRTSVVNQGTRDFIGIVDDNFMEIPISQLKNPTIYLIPYK